MIVRTFFALSLLPFFQKNAILPGKVNSRFVRPVNESSISNDSTMMKKMLRLLKNWIELLIR